MKTLGHAFNVNGLRKCGRKWRTMLKSVPTLGMGWLAACQHQTGVHKYSMAGAVRAPKHRMRVCARHTAHTVQGIKRDTKRENVL